MVLQRAQVWVPWVPVLVLVVLWELGGQWPVASVPAETQRPRAPCWTTSWWPKSGTLTWRADSFAAAGKRPTGFGEWRLS